MVFVDDIGTNYRTECWSKKGRHNEEHCCWALNFSIPKIRNCAWFCVIMNDGFYGLSKKYLHQLPRLPSPQSQQEVALQSGEERCLQLLRCPGTQAIVACLSNILLGGHKSLKGERLLLGQWRNQGYTMREEERRFLLTR
jgi:hypothetical protein